MKKLPVGEKVKIRSATPEDKRKIFEWLTQSNLTKEMMGLPNYPDAKIPTWDEFDTDYPQFYFNGSSPLKGQCFIILEGEIEVGQINYNYIDTTKKCTSMDIWLSDLKYTGKGIGTEAILLLCKYLKENFHCEQIFMSPSKRNLKAIRAYEKAGFIKTNIELSESEKDYNDNLVMVKEI